MDRMDIKKALGTAKLLPIVTLTSEKNIQTVKKVIEGSDIEMVEVAFRSEYAVKAIKEYSSIKDVIIGAGTVCTIKEAEQAIDAGARFLVSPGYHPDVVRFAQENDVPIIPGVLTPTEIQKGISEAGLSIFKLFPVKLIGGLDGIKALKGPFYDICFLPTGGVSEANYLEYLEDDHVIAVGGSFIINNNVTEEGIEEEINKINLLIENIKE